MSCACGEYWRIEGCDLATGRVRSILHPVSFSWQNTLNEVGQGSLTLPTLGIEARDVWPHLTSVYITRIAGGNATREDPVVEFAGMVDALDADSEGSTTVGLKSLDGYLDFRRIREELEFRSMSQTELGAALVNYARPNGIPLEGISAPSQHARDRLYEPWVRKNLGEAIRELSEVINGPDWEFFHDKNADGDWTTRMAFRDRVGADRGVLIQSGLQSDSYSLSINGEDHATVVDALGDGEDEEKLIATARDDAAIYPQFDAAPSWSDVTRMRTLQDHAEGYLEENREPRATPDFSIPGLDPDPRMMRIGDTIGLHVDFGAIAYHGDARILSCSWNVDADNPPTRDYEVVPTGRPSEGILNAVSRERCNDCGRNQ